MSVPSRRAFLKTGAACGSLRPDLLRAQSRPGAKYDLLVRGAISSIPRRGFPPRGTWRLPAARWCASRRAFRKRRRGKIVTPGLVDIHVHVYDVG